MDVTRQPLLSSSRTVKLLPPLQLRDPFGASTLCGSYWIEPQFATTPVAHWSWRLGGLVTHPCALAGEAETITVISGAARVAAARTASLLRRVMRLLRQARASADDCPPTDVDLPHRGHQRI